MVCVELLILRRSVAKVRENGGEWDDLFVFFWRQTRCQHWRVKSTRIKGAKRIGRERDLRSVRRCIRKRLDLFEVPSSFSLLIFIYAAYIYSYDYILSILLGGVFLIFFFFGKVCVDVRFLHAGVIFLQILYSFHFTLRIQVFFSCSLGCFLFYW